MVAWPKEIPLRTCAYQKYWETTHIPSQRTYEVVPNDASGEGFQSTFSVSSFEGNTAKTLLENGANSSLINLSTETLFFSIWYAPNFHDKNSDIAALFWPVNGWSYDSLIGGLYPNTKPEWDYNLRGKTLELAFPVTQANAMLQRIRELFDESEQGGHLMTSTYRSGINIKFGQVFDDLLSQTSTLPKNTDADWSKGTIMFDFPTYLPDSGVRYNEPFCASSHSRFGVSGNLLTTWQMRTSRRR